MKTGRSRLVRALIATLGFALLFNTAARSQSLSVDGDSQAMGELEACEESFAASSEADREAGVPSPQPLREVPAMAWKDTVSILGAPLHWTGKDWAIAGGAVGLIVVAGFADTSVRDATQTHKNAGLDDLTRIVEPFGSEYSYAVLGAYGIVGFAFHDTEARDTAIDGLIASGLASGIITPTLKAFIGRERPNATDDPLVFHPFSNGDLAFPSGHATQAFAVASVISAHSDHLWVSATAYTLAGLVAYARVYHNAHWTSDVVAGALIGTAVGHGVVALNRRIRSGDHTVRVGFQPIFAEGRRGAGLTVVF